MAALLENTGVYRGGTVARPQDCVATLYTDRIEVVSPDGAAIARLPLASITHAKASASALIVNGVSFKVASVEFVATRRKILLAVFGLIPWLIVSYFGEGRRTAVAWHDKIEDLRALQ